MTNDLISIILGLTLTNPKLVFLTNEPTAPTNQNNFPQRESKTEVKFSPELTRFVVKDFRLH